MQNFDNIEHVEIRQLIQHDGSFGGPRNYGTHCNFVAILSILLCCATTMTGISEPQLIPKTLSGQHAKRKFR